jgi:hypothetical protein
MALKKWLLSNMFFRNVLADFGERSGYSKMPGNFTPYFQYKIGDYQPDYYLHFPREPFALQYQNEIFNKLNEYKGYDIISFLEFHYEAYTDKKSFLRFFRYETTDRLKHRLSASRQQKMQSALDWVTEKLQERQAEQQTLLKQQLEQDVRDVLSQEPSPANNPEALERFVELITGKVNVSMQKLIAETEEKISAVTDVLPSGRIELNNQSQQEKLIQLFILLRTLMAPAHISKTEQLFVKFSDSDLATILQMHFSAFKSLKINTVQRKIGEANEMLDHKNPGVQQLNQAMQAFFYNVK